MRTELELLAAIKTTEQSVARWRARRTHAWNSYQDATAALAKRSAHLSELRTELEMLQWTRRKEEALAQE